MDENGEEFYEELERAGQGGTSASTMAGRSASVNWFNTFQRYESKAGNRDPSETGNLADLSEDAACDLPRLQRFATFLMTKARDDKGDLLKPGTCLSYFSGAINFIKSKFSRNDLFSPPMEWNTNIRKSISRDVGRRCIEEGIEITEKSPPVGRVLMARCCRSLLLENSIEALTRRAILVMNFMAVGRSGEVARCTWESSYWCPELEQFVLDWSRQKTSRRNLLGMLPDGDSIYEMDFYHSLGCYMLLGGTVHLVFFNEMLMIIY